MTAYTVVLWETENSNCSQIPFSLLRMKDSFGFKTQFGPPLLLQKTYTSFTLVIFMPTLKPALNFSEAFKVLLCTKMKLYFNLF